MKPVLINHTLIFLLLFFSSNCFAQGENNKWCFGKFAGMDFNNGPPVFFYDSMNTSEGCATACDAAGNLLFYAAPDQVWDRNGNLMPNGSGLLGDNSSTQGAGIIQSFSNPNQYFLFTQGADFQPHNLYYSVVDMSLNGGYGDIVAGQKNILLLTNVSEKMAAIGNGCSYAWLLAHAIGTPFFYAFKVDASGVSITPVVSNSGFYSGVDDYRAGEMKYAPVTHGLALALNQHNSIELHSFDINTGIVNNPISLDTTNDYTYGISYSPDGSKLYVGSSQYDLSLLPNAQAVRNSRVTVGVFTKGMRIGPDNKIYFNTGYNGINIGVINNPNLAGPACNVVYNALATPPVNQSLLLGQDFGFDLVKSNIAVVQLSHNVSACLGLNTYTATAPAGFNTYLWSDGQTTQSDTFSAPGLKWVLSTGACGTQTDTFHLTATMIDTIMTAKDTNVCFANNVPILNAPGGYTHYLWSDGFTVQQDTMSAPGVKWVYAQEGCDMLVDTFKVHDWRDTTTKVTDTIHCVAYSPITIYAPGGYTSYLWSDGKTTQVDTFFSTKTKWVRAVNGCSLLIDTVHFTATAIPSDSVTIHGNDTSICFESGSISVSAPAGFTYYLWNDGSTVQTTAFNGPATKWVYAQKLCYLLIDTFSVSARTTDTVSSRLDTTLCFSNTVTLSANAGYDSYLWSDGNTNPADTFSNNSVKIAAAHKACAEEIDTFQVQFINDLAVDLGPDTSICKGETVRLDASSTYANARYLWQDGNTNKIYQATESGDYKVVVSVGPCNVSDSIRVHQKVIDIKLGNGLIPCHEDSILLDAGVADASYQWQDGSSSRTYKATKEGTYTVKVTQNECSASASVLVRFEGCECVVVLPTAFSPNNDSKNDKFGPGIACPINSYKMMIYNRWGNQVFYSEDVNNRWDGSCKGVPLDGDVFNYYLEFKDGENKVYYYKGTVTLVR